MDRMLKVNEGDPKASVNAFLRDLLTHGKVKGVLALQKVATGRSAFPVLVSDPSKLEADPFAPLMPVSTAKVVSRMTRSGPSNKPIAVVLRPCELRALTELIKLKQADLKNIVTISIECPGTFPLNTFSSLPKDADPTALVMSGKGSEKLLRTACLSCRDPIPKNSDITLGIFGMDVSKEIMVQANTEAGEGLLDGLPLTEAVAVPGREKAVAEVRAFHDAQREALKGRGANVKGIQALSTFFETCINCHNCMKNCPICYCRECLFESNVLEMEADRYVSKAASRGIVKTPTDTLLFHVTRFNHMILSCVECGLCEQACPAGIPLMDIIIPIAENAQTEFEYSAGRDPDEPLPMVVYKEEEFESIGE